MWKGTAPCRAHRFCPLAVERREHFVYLIWDYHSGGDPIICENARFMTVDTAREILKAESKTALENGKETLLIQLMGGDPMKRFEELRSLCEWAWSELQTVKVTFDLTTTLDISGEDAFLWYIDHRDKIRLWLRCERLDADVADFALKTDCGIAFGLDIGSRESLYGDVCWTLKNRIPIRFFCAEDLNAGLCSYIDLLQRMKGHPDALALPAVDEAMDIIEAEADLSQDRKQGKCYDTNGYVWTCPALSHLFLHSWSMDQASLEQCLAKQPQQSLEWLCPGLILRTPKLDKTLHNLHTEKSIQALGILNKQENEIIKQYTRKMISEVFAYKKSNGGITP